MVDTRRWSPSASLELLGADVAEGAMQSPAIVEDLDVVEDRQLGLVPGGEAAVVDQFGLELAPEALLHGVVIAVAASAHAGRDAVPLEQLLELRAGVLHT